ncbi:hypothetical protein [Vaginella massiliensis]|nr:hypothetical protein [Vaginella massiliensis]
MARCLGFANPRHRDPFDGETEARFVIDDDFGGEKDKPLTAK